MKEELLEPVFRNMRVRRVKNHLRADSVVCDIGCGHGTFLRSVSPLIAKGYGFDKKTEDSSWENIELRKLYVNDQIPLDSDVADCVTLQAVLEHLERPEEVLRECHRLLKTSGTIVLTTPAPVSKPILEFLSFKLNIVSPEEIKDHKHYYSSAELDRLLRSVGFVNVSVKGFEFGLNHIATGRKP